jgi:hypothetical protein
MRFFIGLVLTLALGVMGCSETAGTGGSAGDGGAGGTGGDGGSGGDAATFSYSVITSSTGDGTDLLEELRNSTLPTLEAAGAVVYALWGPAPQQHERFAEIAQDKLVVMLSWAQIDAELLTVELEALAAASQVETTLWEAALRGDEPLPGPGFFAHRFELYRTEDMDQVLSLTDGLWVTWEPYWGTKAVGVWRNPEEKDGLTLTFRIAWYEDLDHWEDTRNFSEEPESAAKLWERIILLQAADEGWSAGLLER